MKKAKYLVVIGGSAGSISALCELIKKLPADLEAALVAVIHHGLEPSNLSQILQRNCALKVIDPAPAEPLQNGCLYVSQPNRHLVIRDGCVLAMNGPRENRHRPAVDVLFRSAARSWRSKVAGVVLSGALDDGSAGALAVKARGGVVLVQDPLLAEYGDMPANVVRHVGADYCLPLNRMAEVLVKLVSESPGGRVAASAKSCRDLMDDWTVPPREPSAFTCPECGGALKEVREGPISEYRCHVGHVYSLDTFSEAEAEALERAIWVAFRKLNEHQSIQLMLAKREPKLAHGTRSRYLESAAAAARDIKMLRNILSRL